jgi:hypothetical protein
MVAEEGTESVIKQAVKAAKAEDVVSQEFKIIKNGEKAVQTRDLKVGTGDLRNESPLTKIQETEAIEYAKSLGMPEEKIYVSNNSPTAYGEVFDWLVIGTDVQSKVDANLGTKAANSRISIKGAIAHELVGHRATALAGKSQTIEVLEEAQASIRAARFGLELSKVERVTLLRDAINRLKKSGIKTRDVKERLWINEN